MKAPATNTAPRAFLPTHFRCLAYRCWLSISHCEISRAARRGRDGVQYTAGAWLGHCHGCPQAPGVDARTDPTLTTAEDVLHGTTPPIPPKPWFAAPAPRVVPSPPAEPPLPRIDEELAREYRRRPNLRLNRSRNWEIVLRCVDKYGPGGRAEIAARLGTSGRKISEQLAILKRRGLIKNEGAKWGAIQKEDTL